MHTNSIPRRQAVADDRTAPTRAGRRWIRLIGWIGLGAFALALAGSAIAEPAKSVARLGRFEISVDEYRLFLAWHKASAAKRLFPEAPVVTPGMWNERIGGTTAGMILRREALEDAIETKALQILYLKNGLADAVGYENLREQWADENARRAGALARGLTVYGPEHWLFEDYYGNWNHERYSRLREMIRRSRAAGPAGSPPAAESLTDGADARVRAMARQLVASIGLVVDETALAAVPIP